MKKKFDKTKDPHLDRERDQYENPVPSREYITSYLEEHGKPASFGHIAEAFSLEHPDEQEGLRRRLKAMRRDGQLISNRRGSFALVKDLELVRGRIQTRRDGFGFLIPDDPEQNDIFLSAREIRTVFDDDVVLVSVTNADQRRPEGCIVEVLERNTQQVVGRYIEDRGMHFVDPDSRKIPHMLFIPPDSAGDAKSGDFVVAAITTQPTRRAQPIGKIIEVLGNQLTPGMEVELAIRSHQLPYQWSDEVLHESQRFPAEVSEEDKQGREDLRLLPFVTIDGEDAKDFDDAVYCEYQRGKGGTLYVAIADVSHYVEPETALDQEAFTRGNSVYFPAKVLPMLPETLSNGLCSLKPKVDRLAMVCKMHINAEGEVEEYSFSEAVIHSHARLTYTEVADMLKGEKTEHHRFYKNVKSLHHMYHTLLKQREKRGAIDFETVETKIEFDDNGRIANIVPRVRNDAHRLIEECMLAANITAARYLQKKKCPTLFRVHEGPSKSKLENLSEVLHLAGLRLGGGKKPQAADYAKLVKRIKKRDDYVLLQTMLLRSLQQAVYTPENVGHFGLAYEEYCQFTSPIRRYPDLIVHRGIRHLLRNKKTTGFRYKESDMTTFGTHCSQTERRADLATRDATDWLKCEYMLDRVGETHSGKIVEVTSFGVFVELDDIYVQGLVHITSLTNDYYHFDPKQKTLRGKHSQKTFRLGDAVTIIIAKVDLDNRSIDFDYVS